jgi:hypothetical protein
MIISATSLVVGAGIALTSDDQLITAMVKPIGRVGDVHRVSDQMRHSRSVRAAIASGLITVTMDGTEASDFVAQVELIGLGGTGVNGTKYMFLDIHGGSDTAAIEVINGTPYLIFRHTSDDTSAWTITIPDDYVAATPIYVEVYWSPEKTIAGSAKWVLEYKSVSSGGVVSTLPATATLVQPSPGTAQTLITTGTALSIPSGAVSANALLSIKINRLGKDAADTLISHAWVHLVRISYTGKRFA